MACPMPSISLTAKALPSAGNMKCDHMEIQHRGERDEYLCSRSVITQAKKHVLLSPGVVITKNEGGEI